MTSNNLRRFIVTFAFTESDAREGLNFDGDISATSAADAKRRWLATNPEDVICFVTPLNP